MEEKQPGQTSVEADRPFSDTSQSRTTPLGEAAPPSEPTPQERALLREADKRAKQSRDELAKRGFGDHKGMEGF